MRKSFLQTVSEIKRLYISNKLEDELSGEWGAIVFYRWISFYIGALFIRFGITANTVSVAVIFLCMLLPFSLLFSPESAWIILGLCGIVIAILDCVDGNIARVTNTASMKGQYADFIADILYRIFLYTTLGFIIQAGTADDHIMIKGAAFICLAAALLAVTARLCRIYAEKRFPNTQTAETLSVSSTGGNITSRIYSFFSGLDHLLPLFILVAGMFDVLVWVMVWIFLYSLLDFAYTQWNIIWRLS